MTDFHALAKSINKLQRQALRRISRGQTIRMSMMRDPLIRKCYADDTPKPPRNPNIVEWCDFEAEAYGWRPSLSPFGASLLEALEAPTPESPRRTCSDTNN